MYGPGNDPNTTWDIGAREQGHVYKGMTALAGITGADPAAGAWGYHLHDHLGSTRRIHNQAKDRTARFDFTPYGELFHAENPGAAAPRFTGKTLDAESGLYHFPYRYYNPQNARWLTRDPLGMVDGPNVYVYVRGNPVIRFDRMGLLTYEECDASHNQCLQDCEDAWLNPGSLDNTDPISFAFWLACNAKCDAILAACYTYVTGERACQFVADHPVECSVGAIVIIGSLVYIGVSGGSGACTLVY